MESGVQVTGLRKRFGSVQALDGAELSVARGELVALLGRNGAGKSTLVRVLGTTVLPDEGSASVAGHDVVTAPQGVRRSLGLVLGDERSWYWRLSGRANLEFFGALQGLDRPAARARAQELLVEVQLDHAADRRFDGWSSGMRARLSLARALLVRPPVLLLDEPSKTLDPLVAKDFRALVVDTAHRDGTAVLWVTHDLHEAAAVADRVLVLDAGRVVREVAGDRSAAELEQLMSELVT